LLPGGVNSPVRAFRAVGGHPLFTARALGSRVIDADDNQYLDYVGSWGPAILGHAHPEVVQSVAETAGKGLSFGAPTEGEVRFAELVMERHPSIQMLRCVSSGTEATMSALRVARGFTGRDVIVKFDGAYHGHSDSLLVKAGSGAATFGNPDSAGVPAAIVENTATLGYNDNAALSELFSREGSRIAAVIVEPVAGNMGCVPPQPQFLETILELCARHGALTVLEERSLPLVPVVASLDRELELAVGGATDRSPERDPAALVVADSRLRANVAEQHVDRSPVGGERLDRWLEDDDASRLVDLECGRDRLRVAVGADGHEQRLAEAVLLARQTGLHAATSVTS